MRRPHVYERSVPRPRREAYHEPGPDAGADPGARTSEGAPSVTALDHIQLAMPAGREGEARAFYAGLLGVPEVPKPVRLAPRGGCWFEKAALRIHLGVEEDFRPARRAHPAFLVDDLEGLAAALDSAGHPTRAGERLEGFVRVYVDDPFGNRIELMQVSIEPSRSAVTGDDGRDVRPRVEGDRSDPHREPSHRSRDTPG